MTTGCCCGTPGCRGLASEPEGKCPRCRIDATPSPWMRALKRTVNAALNGREITIDSGRPADGAHEDREAG